MGQATARSKTAQENPVSGEVLGSVYGRNTISFTKKFILYFLLSIMQNQKQQLTNRMENLHLFLCYLTTCPNPQPNEKIVPFTQMCSNT